MSEKKYKCDDKTRKYVEEFLKENEIPYHKDGSNIFLPENFPNEGIKILDGYAKAALDHANEYPDGNTSELYRKDVGPTDSDFGIGWDTDKEFTGRFRTSPDLYPFLVKVLERDNIPFEIERERNGIFLTKYFVTGMKKEDHKKAIYDALCEMQRENSATKIPVYSAKTILNEKEKNRLMKINRTEEYDILDCDRRKLEQCPSLEKLEALEAKERNMSLGEKLAAMHPEYDDSEWETVFADVQIEDEE